jgi:hypothetical protein
MISQGKAPFSDPVAGRQVVSSARADPPGRTLRPDGTISTGRQEISMALLALDDQLAFGN